MMQRTYKIQRIWRVSAASISEAESKLAEGSKDAALEWEQVESVTDEEAKPNHWVPSLKGQLFGKS
ncbi:hypothetical protein [Nitrolancea hollandica]|nr:hypothetical protein [Nitrolancea hollandica]